MKQGKGGGAHSTDGTGRGTAVLVQNEDETWQRQGLSTAGSGKKVARIRQWAAEGAWVGARHLSTAGGGGVELLESAPGSDRHSPREESPPSFLFPEGSGLASRVRRPEPHLLAHIGTFAPAHLP